MNPSGYRLVCALVAALIWTCGGLATLGCSGGTGSDALEVSQDGTAGADAGDQTAGDALTDGQANADQIGVSDSLNDQTSFDGTPADGAQSDQDQADQGPPSPSATIEPPGFSLINATQPIVITFDQQMKGTLAEPLGGSIGEKVGTQSWKDLGNKDTLTLKPKTVWDNGPGVLTLKAQAGDGQLYEVTLNYTVDADAPLVETIQPANGLFLGPRQRIMIVFDSAMDKESLKLSESIGSTASVTWAETVVKDDTLILAPTGAETWGALPKLGVEVADLAGNPVAPTIALTYKALPTFPEITVPIQAIRVSHTDGTHAAAIDPAGISSWVGETNAIYNVAGITFTFNGTTDYTASYQNSDVNKMDKPDDAGLTAATTTANSHAGKIAVFFRYGPSDVTPSADGFSAPTINFVVMPGRTPAQICQTVNAQLLGQSIGQYLGLRRTFFDNGYADKKSAETRLSEQADDPELAFDGDLLVDTPPDPYIASLNQCDTAVMHLALGGLGFLLPRHNLMSLYQSAEKSLSWRQVMLARQSVLVRTNQSITKILPGTGITAIEGETLSAVVTSGTIKKENTANLPGIWSKHQQLLWEAPQKNAEMTFTIVAPTANASYEVFVALTRAPHYGIVKFDFNGNAVGPLIDLYARDVMQSLPISLGTIQTPGDKVLNVRITLTGWNDKKPAALGPDVGLDYILLQKK